MRQRLTFALLPLALVAAFVLAVSALPTASSAASQGYAEKREPAPIETIDVRPAPAKPDHYFAHAVFGLPSGCARPGGYEVGRDGDRFEIVVSIRVPSEPRPCTMIYGTADYDVPLGELELGRTYVVHVNDREISYTPDLAAPPDNTSPTVAPYLDDRSGPEQLLRSYANALHRKEYARAYSYWRPAAAKSELPPFDQFAAGFADTESVLLTLGEITGDAGAGQLYYAVPAQLDARTTAGALQTFVGCYKLHIGRPQMQAAPPFQPLAIEGAIVRQVGPKDDRAALLETACDGSGGRRPAPSI